MERVLGIKDEITYLWSSLSLTKNPFFIIDILIVALIIYWIYLFLKETRAIRILYGIVIIVILYLIGKILNLSTLNFILKGLTTMFFVAIPIVFQPELRMMLERLGRADIVSDFRKLKSTEISQIINEIINSVKKLSSSKTGALIVITQKTGLRDIVETGTKLDSKISSELINTIFFDKTPLHDGALIIKGNKIVAAACTLPLSDDKFDFHLGTRHRAAIGLSEISDAIVIIVSEEKGTISLANKGILNFDIDIYKLRQYLENIIQKGRLINKK